MVSCFQVLLLLLISRKNLKQSQKKMKVREKRPQESPFRRSRGTFCFLDKRTTL